MCGDSSRSTMCTESVDGAYLSPELLKSRSWLPCGDEEDVVVDETFVKTQQMAMATASLIRYATYWKRKSRPHLDEHPRHAGTDGLHLVHEHVPLRLQQPTHAATTPTYRCE